MIRILTVTAALAMAASPSFACPFGATSELATPSTTAAAQPPAPACPTCVVPDQGGHVQSVSPPQSPS